MMQILAPIGLLIIAAATLIPICTGGFELLPVMRWVYGAGRLVSQGALDARGALFFVAAAVFLFVPGTAPRDWLALTMAGAVVQIIASVMIPRRIDRIAREKK